MNVNLEFTMLGPRLTEEQAVYFSTFAQWVVVTERRGRLLVDGIGEEADVNRALSLLTDRDVKVVGAWSPAGDMLPGYALDRLAWLEVAPDDEAEGITTRPTQYRQLHGWAGWADRRVE